MKIKYLLGASLWRRPRWYLRRSSSVTTPANLLSSRSVWSHSRSEDESWRTWTCIRTFTRVTDGAGNLETQVKGKEQASWDGMLGAGDVSLTGHELYIPTWNESTGHSSRCSGGQGRSTNGESSL